MIANEREDAEARAVGEKILTELETLAAPFIGGMVAEAADTNRGVALIDAVLLAAGPARHPGIINGIAVAIGSYVGQCDAAKAGVVMKVVEMGLNAGVQRAKRELAARGPAQ